MRSNSLKDYVTFYAITDNGPEPGMGTSKKVFKSYAEVHEPSAKDVQLGNLELDKTNITVIIRNCFPEYVPKVNQTFTLNTGMYQNQNFNIKHVSPKDINYMKVVGESDGS